MSKPLCTFLCATGLCLTAFAETPQETIANLQKENAALRIAVGVSQKPIVMASEQEVEAETVRAAAVQRINEANQVARQWRSKAINLQRELTYTKALLATVQGTPEPAPTEDLILLPKFRASEDVAQRPAPATDVSDVALHPVLASLH